MPQRTTPKTKQYIPSAFIECEICGQSYYSGYKHKHESSQRHILCQNAINRHLQKFQKLMSNVISV